MIIYDDDDNDDDVVHMQRTLIVKLRWELSYTNFVHVIINANGFCTHLIANSHRTYTFSSIYANIGICAFYNFWKKKIPLTPTQFILYTIKYITIRYTISFSLLLLSNFYYINATHKICAKSHQHIFSQIFRVQWTIQCLMVCMCVCFVCFSASYIPS